MKHIRSWRIVVLMLLLGVAILGVLSTSIQFTSGATVSDQLTWGPERFRGVNLDMSLIREGDLRVLSEEWNANLVRLNLRIRQGDFIQDESDPYHLKEADLQELDRFLDLCEKYGLRVVLANHRPLGSRQYWMPGGEDNRIWEDFKFHDYLIFFWKKLAERYAPRGDVIAGYDLMNEPNPKVQVKGTPSDWNLLASRITKAIREVDKVHPIVIEPIEYGFLSGLKYLKPTGDANTVYSFHFYLPMAFTWQGIQQRPLGISYPGWIDGEYWDKARIKREMQAALDFQMKI